MSNVQSLKSKVDGGRPSSTAARQCSEYKLQLAVFKQAQLKIVPLTKRNTDFGHWTLDIGLLGQLECEAPNVEYVGR